MVASLESDVISRKFFSLNFRNLYYNRIFSNDSFNENIYPPINPINGTDYWKSKQICCNNYAEWQLELNEETY